MRRPVPNRSGVRFMEKIDISKLEPAERDPAALRRTALWLVAFMVLGGLAILFAYGKYRQRVGVSDRPSMESKITDTARLIAADGSEKEFQDLKGNVTLALAIPKDGSERSAPTLAALQKVMETFPEESGRRPQLVVFVLDGSEKQPQEMATALADFGGGPRIWRVAAGEDGKDSVRAFLKNRLRHGLYPYKKDGKLVYDSKLVLLDQHLQMRGIPNSNEGWDFSRVAKMEEAYSLAQQENPTAELIPPPMTQEKLTELLIEAINYLYDNPEESGHKTT